MIRFILALLNLLRVWKKHPPGEAHEQVAGPDAAPPPKKRIVVKSRPTKPKPEPWLRQPGETVKDWWDRMGNNK